MSRSSRYGTRSVADFTRSVCALLFVLLLAGGTSRAQDDAPTEYSAAVKQAIQEINANNYPEALAEFRRAHEIFPNARSLRGIGMVEFELRDYISAARHLEEALTSRVRPLTGSLRSETETLRERARRYLGELRIATDPENADVLIDGSPVQPGSDGVFVLNPGEHLIEVSAAGRLTDTRSVQITGGAQRQLMIALRMVGAAAESVTQAPLPPASTPTRNERTPAYRKWWVWTLVAAVAVAGGTTAALLLSNKEHAGERPVEGTNTTGVTLHALSKF